jgi:hypothetical protein
MDNHEQFDRMSLSDIDVTVSDLLSVLKGLLFMSVLFSVLMVSFSATVEPVSQSGHESRARPSLLSATTTVWGEMQYNQIVNVSTFPVNGIGDEYASLNLSFPVHYIITPNGRHITYNLEALKSKTNLDYTNLWPWGMSDNKGSLMVGSIYYTSTGIPTRAVYWDPSFSASQNMGSTTLTTNILIKERAFAEPGKGAVKGMAEINSNIAVHWGAIAFTIISFGLS